MTPLFLPTALVVLMTASASSFCPKECACFAKSVSCHGMTAFDKNFPSFTEKITFWGSNISIIPGRIFSNVGQELFHSSQRSIHFHSSIIGTIEGEAFINLQNFESILFENVNISRIKEGSFKNLKNIRSFSFLQSNIGIIDQNAFVNFLNISDFRISNTKIESIFDKAFCDLQNISKFEILLSEIKAMDINSFSSFQGISWFELSWNTFESIGCNSLIHVSLASNYSKFAYNSFPCDCNLSFLDFVNYCTYAGGRINIGMNSELGECSPCHSVTHESHSLSIIISTTDSSVDGSVPKEGATTGGLHTDYNTTSTEPWNGTLLAIVNMSNPSLALSKLEAMTITTTTTTITKHSATSENRSASAICSGTCLINNWTNIYNTESTTTFINAAKDVTEETRGVIASNSSSLKISPELTSTGFSTSSATTLPPRSLATILLPRLSTTFLSTRSPIALAATGSPTSSSTTRSPLSSSTTSTPASLSTKPNSLSGDYTDNFTDGYGIAIGLYNGTLSKVSSSSSNTAPAISTTIFRATSSQSSPLSTKTELVLATTTTTTTTNVSVHNSSSKSNVVTIYLSSSVESSTKPFSATRNVNNFGSIAATQPSPDTSLSKTSSSFSSSSSDTVYPKIAFPLWTDATRVSKKTTGVTSEPIKGRSWTTHVNRAFPVTISCILAFTLHVLFN